MPAKSDFAGQPVVQTGSVTIADRDGVIIVSRNFVYAGATETFFHSDVTVQSKTSWDHDGLKVVTTQSGAVTTERYSLAPDGAMIVSVVRPERGRSAWPSSANSAATLNHIWSGDPPRSISLMAKYVRG